MVSDSRKKEIQRETQELLKKFGEALKDVPDLLPSYSKGESTRAEGNGDHCDSEFVQGMLKNAPNSDGTSIIAEKSSWSQ